jgi:hypothetical protein
VIENFIRWLTSNISFDTILTLLGFGFAIYEIRRTKSAVIASKEATEKTIQLLSDRSSVSDIATIINGLRETQTAFRGYRYETALLRLQDLRERLYALRNREGFKNEERLIEIQGMVFTLKRMQDSLEMHISTSNTDKISVHKNNSRLAEYATLISGWREEMHYLDRSIKK